MGLESEPIAQARPPPAPKSAHPPPPPAAKPSRPPVAQPFTRHAPPHQSASPAPNSSVYSIRNPPPSRVLKPGVTVKLIKKEDQPTGKTTEGEIIEVLTNGDHPRGVKVRCTGGLVGRVVGLA